LNTAPKLLNAGKCGTMQTGQQFSVALEDNVYASIDERPMTGYDRRGTK
jgi:hypothetical protein